MALCHAIMTALIDDDMSGYELAKSFDASLGFFWHASHQQIYQELKKLAAKKWLSKREVSQFGKPNKISYGLTQLGREELAKWVYASSKIPASKDDLFVKLYNLSQDNVTHIAALVQQRREDMMQRLYLYEKIRRRHYDKPTELPLRRQGIYLSLKAGIDSGEQFLAWCDEALEMLSKFSQDDARA